MSLAATEAQIREGGNTQQDEQWCGRAMADNTWHATRHPGQHGDIANAATSVCYTFSHHEHGQVGGQTIAAAVARKCILAHSHGFPTALAKINITMTKRKRCVLAHKQHHPRASLGAVVVVVLPDRPLPVQYTASASHAPCSYVLHPQRHLLLPPHCVASRENTERAWYPADDAYVRAYVGVDPADETRTAAANVAAKWMERADRQPEWKA
ncbi:hypothetical protein THASP1DRAFT_21629 [Thamnocephalis sphaerospora]|uniref:Uncharacterized protein n=1 Tax=Thamnocephalis sphaerospora TaxID=78915 RepID=A0A4P9XWI8_9FUNG|nr:hypothetical protein THASP1DRAFT_21629 [Thamnocephalis sphaerospora]|eukprot:RKP10715.1 hypothetical protein THASP1DRAFT_21629 [Thamnocephalis sphaerospora]